MKHDGHMLRNIEVVLSETIDSSPQDIFLGFSALFDFDCDRSIDSDVFRCRRLLHTCISIQIYLPVVSSAQRWKDLYI